MIHRIAFIGAGTIGGQVGRYLLENGSYCLAALRRRPDTPLTAGIQRLATPEALFQWQPDLVVEMAAQEAVHQYANRVLRAGIPFLVTSVGALADSAYLTHLRQIAMAHGSRILVPSGAVASLDYLRAVGADPDAHVLYESRKPVAAWRDELMALGHDPDHLDDEVVLYEGTADVAAQMYPQNLNVAATLALAGAGMARTDVRVVADPAAAHNRHTLEVSSAAGSLETKVINHPSTSNPKTSAVVARSVVSTIHHYFSPLQFL